MSGPWSCPASPCGEHVGRKARPMDWKEEEFYEAVAKVTLPYFKTSPKAKLKPMEVGEQIIVKLSHQSHNI